MPPRTQPPPPKKARSTAPPSADDASTVVVLPPEAARGFAGAKGARGAAVKGAAAKAAKPVVVVREDGAAEEEDEEEADEEALERDPDELSEAAFGDDEDATIVAVDDDEDLGKVDWEEEDGERPAKRSRRATSEAPGSTSIAPVSGVALGRVDPLSLYMREVQRHPVLSPEEQQAIAKSFLESNDPELAAKLVTTNLRLVVKIAYEYRRACKNIMDLVQEGNIGLLQAVKRYDPYRGVRLSSYAAWWIRAYMLRYVLNNFRLVKLGTTQNQRRLFFNLNKARAKLAAMGIEATDEAIAKQLDVTTDDVREMSVRLGSSEASLDAPVGNGGDDGKALARIDAMPSLDAPADESLAQMEMLSLMREHLVDFRETLPAESKELVIFDKRLVAEEPLTLQEIGDSYGISRERVRQLEQRVTSKLRAFLIERVGEVSEEAP
jgi:RNA polymerase sigma-32 factor